MIIYCVSTALVFLFMYSCEFESPSPSHWTVAFFSSTSLPCPCWWCWCYWWYSAYIMIIKIYHMRDWIWMMVVLARLEFLIFSRPSSSSFNSTIIYYNATTIFWGQNVNRIQSVELSRGTIFFHLNEKRSYLVCLCVCYMHARLVCLHHQHIKLAFSL